MGAAITDIKQAQVRDRLDLAHCEGPQSPKIDSRHALIHLAEAEVAVGDEGTHAARLGELYFRK